MNNKPKQYVLVTDYAHDAFTNEIQRLLDLGWEFRGGLHITGANERYPRYHQAMVKT